MKIIYCGELDRTPEAPDHMGIRQGLKMLVDDPKSPIEDFMVVDPILNTPDQAVSIINAYGADLVIHGNTDSLANGIIPRIKTKQVFFMGDYRREYNEMFKVWVPNGNGLSALFISNKDQLDMWSKAFGVPAYFWPHGCFVPDILEKDPALSQELVFIGSMYEDGPLGERTKLIREIARNSPIPLKIINEHDVVGRNKVWHDIPKIYYGSKIVLDISHYWDVDSYASGRYWYTGGLGACTVTKRFPGCEEFYKDKEHKWYFDTAQEAVDLIIILLMNDDIREQTKVAAYTQNRLKHNYKIRFEDLLSKL